MHEMPYVKAALSKVLEAAGGRKVKVIRLELGSNVSDLQEFRELFFMLSESTSAGSAKLDIKMMKTYLKCHACKKQMTAEYSPIRCPKCGSPDIETNANEVKVIDIEVEG